VSYIYFPPQESGLDRVGSRAHSRIVAGQLDAITLQLTLQFLKNISSSANVGTLLSTAPELVARPIYYTVDNLRPFDVPVYVFSSFPLLLIINLAFRASAVTFVGLIYLLILSVSPILTRTTLPY
jgi:hypothetical protein